MTEPSKTQSNQLSSNARCIDCEYNLAFLTENRCPECGRPFDPDNRITYIHYYPHENKLPTPLFIFFVLISTICIIFPLINILWFLAITTVTISYFHDKKYKNAFASLFVTLYILFLVIMQIYFYLQ
ncbi:hypothetical protein JD969_10005 [Planctomycetota bacterium]|nr:hypothetical protein JD969_10005 [Planctomycetota bacterium]